MKLGFISDLHMDVNSNFEIRENILQLCNRKNLDYLIIAGDFSSDYYSIPFFIDYIQRNSNTKIKFIPGNHDLYTSRGKHSKEIYDDLLKLEECLISNPLVIDNYVILGNTGWYDYTFKDSAFTDELLKRKRYKGYTWSDKRYFKWDDLSDAQISELMLNNLREQLNFYKEKNIIAVTHTVPFVDFVEYKDLDPTWNYFSAFIGSEKIGNLYKEYPVKVAVFGHTHTRQRKLISGIECICAPLGNYSEFIQVADMYKEIEETVQIVVL